MSTQAATEFDPKVFGDPPYRLLRVATEEDLWQGRWREQFSRHPRQLKLRNVCHHCESEPEILFVIRSITDLGRTLVCGECILGLDPSVPENKKMHVRVANVGKKIAKRELMIEKNLPILQVLSKRPGQFCYDMCERLEQYPCRRLSRRQIEVIQRIYCEDTGATPEEFIALIQSR